METFRREGRAEVRFSRLMVGVYAVLGLGLLACGITLVGIGLGVISPGTGTAERGDIVIGIVMALIGLFILTLGIAQARPSTPPVVVDAEGVHVQGQCIPWVVISGFGTHRYQGSGPNSHLLATVLVDEATVTAWTADRTGVGGRRSRLHPLASVGPDGIALPFNLAVNAKQLRVALEAIRGDVSAHARDRSNP